MAFVLTPVPPIEEWLSDFETFAKRSPGFFAGRPVVVDISQMPPSRPELVHMLTELRRRNIVIMGLDGRTPGELGADARGLPPILSGGKDIPAVAQISEAVAMSASPVPAPAESATVEAAPEAPEVHVAPGAATAPAEPPVDPAVAAVTDAALAAVEKAIDAPEADTLIIEKPVRSGQSIVHLTGDVIVIGSVASGSEVVSSGSIHIYGALRGRAIAGSAGNKAARIFTSELKAELVAINGLYKTADDLSRDCVGRAAHAWLDGDALKMAAF